MKTSLTTLGESLLAFTDRYKSVNTSVSKPAGNAACTGQATYMLFHAAMMMLVVYGSKWPRSESLLSYR